MAGLEILDPTVEPRKQPLTYVPRPDSLKGKRIGARREHEVQLRPAAAEDRRDPEAGVRRRRDAHVAQAQLGRARPRRDHRRGEARRRRRRRRHRRLRVLLVGQCARRNRVREGRHPRGVDRDRRVRGARAGPWRRPGACPSTGSSRCRIPIANLTEAQLDQRAREIAPEVVEAAPAGPGVAATRAPPSAECRPRDVPPALVVSGPPSPDALGAVAPAGRPARASPRARRDTRRRLPRPRLAGGPERGAPLVVVLHGLEGSSRSHYVGGLLRELAAARAARRSS